MNKNEGRTVKMGSARKGYRFRLTADDAAYMAGEMSRATRDRDEGYRSSLLRYAGRLTRQAPAMAALEPEIVHAWPKRSCPAT